MNVIQEFPSTRRIDDQTDALDTKSSSTLLVLFVHELHNQMTLSIKCKELMIVKNLVKLALLSWQARAFSTSKSARRFPVTNCEESVQRRLDHTRDMHCSSLFAKKSNDAFLNSLEEINGKDPSQESLAEMRETASSSIAAFLSSFGDKELEVIEAEINSTEIEPALPQVQWDVYVCMSKACKERGASATLDTFQSLSPPSVQVHPAILSKTKAKGPNVRCVQTHHPYKAFEINNVNDIDKVYRILTKHMGIEDISTQARNCLKYTYDGNIHLEKNELTEAIASYNKALSTNYAPQEGILLLLRATGKSLLIDSPSRNIAFY
jgi:hypothetical protein